MVDTDLDPKEKLEEIHAILNNYDGNNAIKRIRNILYGEPLSDEPLNKETVGDKNG